MRISLFVFSPSILFFEIQREIKAMFGTYRREKKIKEVKFTIYLKSLFSPLFLFQPNNSSFSLLSPKQSLKKMFIITL